jgi:ribosomal protein S27E
MNSKFHGYLCGGCGHTTITDKHYKIKLIHCAVCGHKDTMSYLSKFKVDAVRTSKYLNNLKGEMTI